MKAVEHSLHCPNIHQMEMKIAAVVQTLNFLITKLQFLSLNDSITALPYNSNLIKITFQNIIKKDADDVAFSKKT